MGAAGPGGRSSHRSALDPGRDPARDLAREADELAVARGELRLAEEELRAQQRRLDDLLAHRADPRAWPRELVGTLPVPALVSDPRGTVIDLNAAAAVLLARPREEVVARPLAELVDARGARLLAETLAGVVAAPRPRTVTLPLVVPVGPPADVVLVVGAGRLGGSGELMLTWVAGDTRPQAGDPASGLRAAEALAEMSRLPLDSGGGTRSLLARAALLVEKALPACDGVSITLGAPGEPEEQATDSVFAQAVDGAQLRAGEGPCLQAYETGRPVHVDDLPSEPRWPGLARLAGPLGVRSVLGCPLRADGRSLGVLNVYARAGAAFGARDRAVAELLVTAVVAVVLETRDRRELTRLSEQLQQALKSRAVIDQAKGVLMARHGGGPDEAFARLVATSRRANTKVRDVAQQLVDDAARPGPAGDGPATSEG